MRVTRLRGLFVSLPGVLVFLAAACDQSPSFVANERGAHAGADANNANGSDGLDPSADALAKKSSADASSADGGDSDRGSDAATTASDATSSAATTAGAKELGSIEKSYKATVTETAALSLTWSGSRVTQELALVRGPFPVAVLPERHDEQRGQEHRREE